eukprot:11474_5
MTLRAPVSKPPEQAPVGFVRLFPVQRRQGLLGQGCRILGLIPYMNHFLLSRFVSLAVNSPFASRQTQTHYPSMKRTREGSCQGAAS